MDVQNDKVRSKHIHYNYSQKSRAINYKSKRNTFSSHLNVNLTVIVQMVGIAIVFSNFISCWGPCFL